MKCDNATVPGRCSDHCGEKNKEIKRQICNIHGISISKAFEVLTVKQVKHSVKRCVLFKQEYYYVSLYITTLH